MIALGLRASSHLQMQTKEMRETTPVLRVTQLQQLCSSSLPEVSLSLQKVCHVLLKTCQKGISQQFDVLFIPYYNPYYKLSQKEKAEKQICTQTRPNIDFTIEQINFKTVSYRYFQQSGYLKTNTFSFQTVLQLILWWNKPSLADPVWCPL